MLAFAATLVFCVFGAGATPARTQKQARYGVSAGITRYRIAGGKLERVTGGRFTLSLPIGPPATARVASELVDATQKSVDAKKSELAPGENIRYGVRPTLLWSASGAAGTPSPMPDSPLVVDVFFFADRGRRLILEIPGVDLQATLLEVSRSWTSRVIATYRPRERAEFPLLRPEERQPVAAELATVSSLETAWSRFVPIERGPISLRGFANGEIEVGARVRVRSFWHGDLRIELSESIFLDD